METEALMCEEKAAKAPAAEQVAVAARLRGSVEVIVSTMHRFRSSEIQAAAKKAGFTPAQVSAALNLLMGIEQAKPEGFNPQAAGRQLVEALQAAEGGAWTGEELEAHFNLTAAVLHRRRKEHRIIYWRDARHKFHYPQWQFTPTGALLPGIQEVLEQFASQDEWRVMSYFLGERAQLDGQRPLDLLRQGAVGKVLEHAKIHAEENTW